MISCNYGRTELRERKRSTSIRLDFDTTPNQDRNRVGMGADLARRGRVRIEPVKEGREPILGYAGLCTEVSTVRRTCDWMRELRGASLDALIDTCILSTC